MKVSSVGFGLVSGIISAGIFLPAMAQVTSDGTTNTTVNTNGNNFTILNGIENGNNLFHSFSNFSLPTNSSATFDLVNTPNITTIFSRVTGGNVSNIDGLIQTLNGNNAASLFLMNPNGIVFGQNASLNIGGSFIGTTANSIKFSDGAEFSAVNPNQAPLLTMSVPVGLQMGQNPGNITVEGNGHQLSGGFPTTVTGSRGSTKLRTHPGRTLALVGGEISLNGGVLSGEAGLIHLGAVGQQNTNSVVSLIPTNTGWDFNYAVIDSFAPMQLSHKALIDASGTQTGNIQLTGSKIEITNGSWVLIENQGDRTGGNIRINATKSLIARGRSDDNTIPTRIYNTTRSAGQGGELHINTQQFSILETALVMNSTMDAGNGGNTTIVASESITLDNQFPGQSPAGINTILGTATSGSGHAGDLTISTRQLTLFPGGSISGTTVRNTGRGGNITVNATEFIDLIGKTSRSTANGNATISNISLGKGASGQIEINTPQLRIVDGGGILTTNVGSGAGGNIILNVPGAITMSGQINSTAFGVLPSRINASTDTPSVITQMFLGLSPIPSGASGSVEINTPNLALDNKAEIQVRNQGSGNGGSLAVSGDRISVDNQAKIVATSDSGKGGNVTLQLQDLLLLRNGSLINASAGGTGNGGNITINSPVIAGFENSDIIANAVEGNGGNIDITTQGIFGLEFRDQLTEESDITASSQFGVNGTVQINNIGVDPSSALVELPVTTTDKSQQIARGCADTSGSSFIATGRGGIPVNPNQDIKSDRTWSDIRDISAYRQDKPVTAKIPAPANPVIQATTWRRNQQGEVELIAENSSTQVQKSLTCAALPQS